MKKSTLVIAGLCCLLLVVLLPGCRVFGQVKGTGNVISQLYNHTDFTEIEIGSAFEVEVVPLDTFTVSISAQENLFDYVEVSQSGQVLKIGMKPLTFTNADLKAVITLPALSRLRLSGASQGTAKGFRSTGDFKLELSGASNLDIDIEAGTAAIQLSGASELTGRLISAGAEMELSGASQATLNGSAGSLTLQASGSSDADLSSYPLQNAVIDLSGASTADITVSGTLDAELSGASTLNYTGSPALGNTRITGDSNLNHVQ